MLRKLLQQSSTMAVVAAGEALDDAGLRNDAKRLTLSGIFIGSVSFEMSPELFVPALDVSINKTGDFDSEYFANRGMAQLDPLLIVKGLPNAGLCGIAIEFGLLGPNLNIANDSIGGTQAIAAATAAIANGDAEIAIAGAYDSLLQPEYMAAHFIESRFANANHTGYSVGEGAAMCVLESIEHARSRGARVYAEIASVEENCGSEQKTCSALAGVARRAIESAGVECSEQVPNIVFGDLLGIHRDDDRELCAARMVLGKSAAITGHIGAIGFTGAATGVFSFVHAVLSLSTGVVPPTLGRCYDQSQPVRIIAQAEEAQTDMRLVWHSDQGLKNVAIVLRRADFSN
jgi:3-oxoacyl-[acyl-carrier-protein] synthase II